MAFPPTKKNRTVTVKMAQAPYNPGPMITTGKTISDTLKVKQAGITSAPGLEKNVNLF